MICNLKINSRIRISLILLLCNITLFGQIPLELEISANGEKFTEFKISELSNEEILFAAVSYLNIDRNDLLEKNISDKVLEINHLSNYPSEEFLDQINEKSSSLFRNQDRPSFEVLEIKLNSDTQFNSRIRVSNIWYSHSSREERYDNDILEISLNFIVNENRIKIQPDTGHYYYNYKSKNLTYDRSKNIQDLFNKKGNPKLLYRGDYNKINDGLTQLANSMRIFIIEFTDVKKSVISSIQNEVIQQKRKDSIYRQIELDRIREDSIYKRQSDSMHRVSEIENRFSDSINSLFSGIVISNITGDDSYLEIIQTGKRINDTILDFRKYHFYWKVQGTDSFLKIKNLDILGSKLNYAQVKGRHKLFETKDGEGFDRAVNVLIEIQPVEIQTLNNCEKFKGYWKGNMNETIYKKSKIKGDWELYISNTGEVRGKLMLNYTYQKNEKSITKNWWPDVYGYVTSNGEIILWRKQQSLNSGFKISGNIVGNRINCNWKEENHHNKRIAPKGQVIGGTFIGNRILKD